MKAKVAFRHKGQRWRSDGVLALRHVQMVRRIDSPLAFLDGALVPVVASCIRDGRRLLASIHGVAVYDESLLLEAETLFQGATWWHAPASDFHPQPHAVLVLSGEPVAALAALVLTGFDCGDK